jgi:hypothetical protein
MEVTVWDPLEGVQLFDQREALRDLATETTQATLRPASSENPRRKPWEETTL